MKISLIFQKLKQKGIVGTVKALLSRLPLPTKGPIKRFLNYQNLNSSKFVVDFVHEGGVKITLPKIPMLNVIFGIGNTYKKHFQYYTRPNSEVLLRKTIYELYRTEYLSKSASIIDIGCWIADNSLVWVSSLDDSALVLAIDPSKANLAYGKRLADFNNISNVKWVEAVCSEKEGEELYFDGDLDHAMFKEKGGSYKFLVSTTLDRIVEKAGNISIGLVHIDVEGFEMSVLRGSRKLIEKNKPTIVFEQHISSEDVSEVGDFLKGFGYQVFMINEVLPGCNFDCRNFIAFDSSKKLPVLEEFDQKNGKNLGIFSATFGPRLIEV